MQPTSSDFVIISSTEQINNHSAANLSLVKFGTVGQTVLGAVITAFIIAATVVTVVLVSTGVSYVPPVVRPDYVTAYKHVPTPIYPLLNDYDPKGGKLSIESITQPKYGTAVINSDGQSITYTSNALYAGTDIFSYTVTNQVLSASNIINVTVLDIPPIPIDFELNVLVNSENNSFALFNISQDGRFITDPAGGPMALVGVTQAQNGQAWTEGNLLYYTPHRNYIGTDNVTYAITDFNETVYGNITFNVHLETPKAIPDNYILQANTIDTLYVLENDFDPNNVTMSISYLGISFAPIFLTDNNTAVIYQCLPTTAPYSDSFEFGIIDALGATTTSYVTLSIVNTPPTAENVTTNVVKNSENNRINLNYIEVDKMDVNYIEIVEGPFNGSITLVNISTTNQVPYAGAYYSVTENEYHVLYTPEEGFTNTDYFIFSVTDTYSTTYGYVVINIETPAPTAVNLTFDSISNIPTLLNLIKGNIDPVGDPLGIPYFDNMTSSNGGKLSWFNSSFVLYTSPSMFVGEETFAYTICDLDNTTLTSTANITIHVYDVPPIVNPINVNCSRFYNITIDIGSYVSSPSHTPLFIASVGEPSSGATVNITNDRQSILFSAGSVPETVTFSYTVADIHGLNASSIVTVDIYDIPPVAVNVNVSVLWNTSITINVIPNDTDVYHEPLTIYSYSNPAYGSVSIVNNKLFYSPNNGFVGIDSFTYVVTDGYTNSQPGTILVDVYDVAPQCNLTVQSIHWSSSVLINVLANCFDKDGDTVYLYSIASQPSHGNASISSNEILYTPNTNPGYLGNVTFTFLVTDYYYYDTVGTVVVVLTDIELVPNNVSTSVHWSDVSKVITVLSSTTDSAGNSIYIYNVTQPNMGGVQIVSDSLGTVNYSIPDPPVLGTANFSYYITDSVSISQSAGIVTVEITDNDMPQAQNQTKSVQWRTFTNDGYVVFTGYNAIVDQDGDVITASVTSQPFPFGFANTTTSNARSLLFYCNPPQLGLTSFGYSLSDGMKSTYANITVDIYDNAPVAYNYSITLNPSQLNGYYLNVIQNAYDVDIADMPYLKISYVFNSSLTNGSIAYASSDTTIYFVPKSNWTGYEIVDYEITDGMKYGYGTINFSIPFASAQPNEKYYTLQWSKALEEYGILLNITEGIEITGEVELTGNFSTPSHGGTVSLVILDGIYYANFTPAVGFLGTETFNAEYSFDETNSTIFVSVTIIDNPPPLLNQSVSLLWSTVQNGTIFDVLQNGQENNGNPVYLVSAEMTSGTNTGTVKVFNATSVLYYPPAPVNGLAYLGEAEFEFTATDGAMNNSAFVQINIYNNAPIAYNKQFSVHWSHYQNGRLLDVINSPTADYDPDTPPSPLSLYSVSEATPLDAANISTSDNCANISGLPPASLVGSSFTFTYTISDGASTANATVTVSITDSLPSIPSFSANVQWRETNVPLQIIVNRTDSYGDTLTIESTVSSNVANATAYGIEGNITYTPPPYYTGQDTLTYTYTDGALTSTGYAYITVYDNAPTTVTFNVSENYESAFNFTFDIIGHPGVSDPDPEDVPYLFVVDELSGLNPGDNFTTNGKNLTIYLGPNSRLPGTLNYKYYVSDGLKQTAGNIVINLNNELVSPQDQYINITRIYGQTNYIISDLLPSYLAAEGYSLKIISGGKLVSGTDNVTVTIPNLLYTGTLQVQFAYAYGPSTTNSAIAYISFINYPPVCGKVSLIVDEYQVGSVSINCTDKNGDPIYIQVPNGGTCAPGPAGPPAPCPTQCTIGPALPSSCSGTYPCATTATTCHYGPCAIPVPTCPVTPPNCQVPNPCQPTTSGPNSVCQYPVCTAPPACTEPTPCWGSTPNCPAPPPACPAPPSNDCYCPIAVSSQPPPSGNLWLNQGVPPTITYNPQQQTGTWEVQFFGTDTISDGPTSYLALETPQQEITANNITWPILAIRSGPTYSEVINYLLAANVSNPTYSPITLTIGSTNCSTGTGPGNVQITVNPPPPPPGQPGPPGPGNDYITFQAPNTLYNGSCYFEVQINVGPGSVGTTAYVFVQIYSNPPPVAVDTTYFVQYQSGVYFSLSEQQIMANNYDPLGGTLQFLQWTTPSSYTPTVGAGPNSYQF